MSGTQILDLDAFDTPLGGLPSMGGVELGRTFVVAASAEVRFISSDLTITNEMAEQIRQGIGAEDLPQVEATQMGLVNIVVTPNGATQQTETHQGWKLWSGDRRTSVTLLPAMVIVETSRYQSFNASLGDLLNRAAQQFAEVTGERGVQRIGLRYINRLFEDDTSSPDSWAALIRPGFSGVLGGEWADLVRETRQMALLRLDPTSSARVNTAVLRDDPPSDTYSFVIDIDVFREQVMEFELTQVANHARRLNRTAFSLFAQVLTEEYFDSLRRNETSRGL